MLTTSFPSLSLCVHSAVLGKYCETRDLHLAFLIYRRAGGPCDEDLIRVSITYGRLEDLARYALARCDGKLWDVLVTHEGGIVEQITLIAPEAETLEQVTTVVQALEKSLQIQGAVAFLEQVVLHNSRFSTDGSLQTLFLMKAIEGGSHDLVRQYVECLHHYDGSRLVTKARSDTSYDLAYDMQVQIAKVRKPPTTYFPLTM